MSDAILLAPALPLSLALLELPLANAAAQPPAPASWTLTFRYGAGAPNDTGPLGHCTATITSDGKARVESRTRPKLPPRVVLETQALDGDQLEALAEAANAALREPPFARRGANADGSFLRLERTDTQPARVFHSQMNDFASAPPAMQAVVRLMNQLLPEEERIPLPNRP